MLLLERDSGFLVEVCQNCPQQGCPILEFRTDQPDAVCLFFLQTGHFPLGSLTRIPMRNEGTTQQFVGPSYLSFPGKVRWFLSWFQPSPRLGELSNSRQDVRQCGGRPLNYPPLAALGDSNETRSSCQMEASLVPVQIWD